MERTTLDKSAGVYQQDASDDTDSHPIELDHFQQLDRSSEDSLVSGEHNEAHQTLSENPAGPPRTLTFIHGLAIVISFQIGSGIFSASAAVRVYVSSIAIAMLAWWPISSPPQALHRLQLSEN